MFWIPICFVAAIIFIIRNAHNAGIKNRLDNQLSKHEEHYKVFADKVRLTSEEKWKIDQQLNSAQEKKRVIHDFMNDPDKLWDEFAVCSLAPHMVLAATIGKLYEDPYFDQTMLFTINPKGCSVIKAYEMNEKFLLRVESELNKHGIITTLVANYNGSDYESVRAHVKNDGYIKSIGRISYRWSNSITQLDEVFDHY